MSKNARVLLSLAVATAALMSRVTPALAITDEEVFRTFRFNFVNPGGRAGAMGGAFVAIADDATAAQANPAGLVNLISPEFFTELRLDSADTTALAAFVDDPSGSGGTLLTESQGDPENVLFPSFISYVHPFKHWVIGVSRQEVLHSNVDTVNLFTNKPTFPSTTVVEARGNLESLLENYNLSFGFRGGEKFAGGVTLTYARLKLDSRTDNLFNFGRGLENDYATAVDDRDEDFSWAAGVLYKPVDIIHFGAVYRAGASFDLREEILDTRPAGNYPSALVLADYLGNRNVVTDLFAPFGIGAATFDDPLFFENHFEVPDQYGVGFGIHPTDALTIAIDVVHIEYSDLEQGFVGNVNALTFPGAGEPFLCDPDLSSPNPDGTFPCDYFTPVATYQIDDETVYHLGVEYVWSIKEKTPFAVRVGAYNDPNTRLVADYPPEGVAIADDDTFPEGDTEMHYTAGFGFVIQDKFQADFSGDFSGLGQTYVASIIFHF
jgi:long-subunit fatty acid transport protein